MKSGFGSWYASRESLRDIPRHKLQKNSTKKFRMPELRLRAIKKSAIDRSPGKSAFSLSEVGIARSCHVMNTVAIANAFAGIAEGPELGFGGADD